MIRNRYGWIERLEALSPQIGGLNIKSYVPDDVYKVKNQDAVNKDAFNFADSAEHNAIVVRAINILSELGSSDDMLRKYLTDLTSQNTYGTFCELAAYEWFNRYDIRFSTQIPMDGTKILNPNGSDLDGLFHLASDVYFDVKGFAFHEHLVALLIEKLAKIFTAEEIIVEGSIDADITNIQQMLGKEHLALVEELQAAPIVQRGRMRIQRRPKRSVSTFIREANPYELAENNSLYAFNYAKQFVRDDPFVLIFIIHPWFDALSLSVNFSRFTEDFTRSFARRAFIQHIDDATVIYNMTRGEASRLLSAIFFLDIWPLPKDDKNKSPKCKAFYNPNAKNPISEQMQMDLLRDCRPEMSHDNFRFDNY